ncbi:hypothetical protein ABKN59_004289 [Abortiporus biennis]
MGFNSKRFHISVENMVRSRDIGSQIIFTLTPEEFVGDKSSKDTQPVVWKVFDLRSSDICELQCGVDLGISTTRISDQGNAEIIYTRLVPNGHRTELKRNNSSSVYFEECSRSREDIPRSIVAINSSQTPQSFALCNVTIPQYQHEPIFEPLLLFNQIQHDKGIRVKTNLILEAFCGTGFTVKQVLQRHNMSKLTPLRDDKEKEWVVNLEEAPISSYLTIYKDKNGGLSIRPGNNDTDRDQSGTIMQTLSRDLQEALREIKKLKGLVYESQAMIQQLDREVKALKSQSQQRSGRYGNASEIQYWSASQKGQLWA